MDLINLKLVPTEFGLKPNSKQKTLHEIYMENINLKLKTITNLSNRSNY